MSGAQAYGLTEVGRHFSSNKHPNKPWNKPSNNKPHNKPHNRPHNEPYNRPHNEPYNKPSTTNKPAEQNAAISQVSVPDLPSFASLNCAAQISDKNEEIGALRQQVNECNATLLDRTSGIEKLFARATVDELMVILTLIRKVMEPAVSDPVYQPDLQELSFSEAGAPSSPFFTWLCGMWVSAGDIIATGGQGDETLPRDCR